MAGRLDALERAAWFGTTTLDPRVGGEIESIPDRTARRRRTEADDRPRPSVKGLYA
jgi:hypothetical protein